MPKQHPNNSGIRQTKTPNVLERRAFETMLRAHRLSQRAQLQGREHVVLDTIARIAGETFFELAKDQ